MMKRFFKSDVTPLLEEESKFYDRSETIYETILAELFCTGPALELAYDLK